MVSKNLIWLKDYPQSLKKFSESLRRYSNKTNDNPSVIADDFRKALEIFFQEFFGKSKSLENMKKDYGDYLKIKGMPTELANDFVLLLNCYTTYNNNYAKHHDRTSEKALEYIMYQTGNIIRLIIQLNN